MKSKQKLKETVAKDRLKVAIVLQLWNNYDRGILPGIAAFARENPSWSVFVEEVEHQNIPNLRDWDGDGLIVNFDNRESALKVQNLDLPVVAVGGGRGWHDPASGIPYVITDDQTIGRLAAEHLLERGLTRFAYCGYPPTPINVWAANRARAFTERLAEAGHDCHLFNGRYTTARHWDRMQAELVDWLLSLPKPIGVMGCYDYRARHVLEACRTAGLKVPDDVAVIGVDNDTVCDLASPPLTSIEQGRFQVGYQAAIILNRLMTGMSIDDLPLCMPPVGVVARQSTDLVYVTDSKVSQALSMIREQACHGLQTETLAERLGISRGTLDKRFKELLGRTADQEIRRIRLAQAQELLIRTSLPIRDIAARAGYGNEQYLITVMRTSTGSTPAQYRRDHRHADPNQPIHS